MLGFSFAHFLKWFNLAFEQTLRTWELNKALREEEEEEEERRGSVKRSKDCNADQAV